MKKLLIVAVALASVNAFASRARMNALGNSAHLVDTQTVLSNPADIMSMGDYVNFESGTTAGGAKGANSEGTITRTMGDSKLGLTLGYQSKNASIWGLRSSTNAGLTGTGANAIISQQNPVNLTYGLKMNDMNLGATLVYSNYNDKQNDVKESSSGIRLGFRNANMDAKLGIGLDNKFSTATEKFKGTGGFSGGFGYMMEDVYLNAGFETAGFKTEDAASVQIVKFDQTSVNVGAIKSHKKDGSELFYGVSLVNTVTKREPVAGETKTTAMTLPITVGMEVDAASWMTLRGSITQTTLINSSKSEFGGATAAETAPGANNTTATVGAGLKFSKLTLDGSLGNTATQEINGTNLLGTVGLTYMF